MRKVQYRSANLIQPLREGDQQGWIGLPTHLVKEITLGMGTPVGTQPGLLEERENLVQSNLATGRNPKAKRGQKGVSEGRWRR